MSSTKEFLNEIRRANSQKSTGPNTRPGKQRSSMNAVKHNLSGQNLILLETEIVAYNRMATSMLNDLNPKSEPERQIAQKIIDSNFRLNRLTAIENNMFSFGLVQNELNTPHDDHIETMAAQTRAWIAHANAFDSLGRYEARLSRRLLKYQEEFERLQTERRKQELADQSRSCKEIERDEPHRRESVVRPNEDRFIPASFGQIASELLNSPGSYRILSCLTPPHLLQKSADATTELQILKNAA